MDAISNSFEKELLQLPTNFEVIEGQFDRWSRALPGHEEYAKMGTLCTNFFENKQWTEIEKSILEEAGRPYLTKNKIKPLVQLILGYFRQNRYDINCLAAADSVDVQDVAETLTALFKQIQEANGGIFKDAEVFQDGLITSRGYWGIELDFDNNELGEIGERCIDPFSVMIDPEAQSYDPNDKYGGWNYFIETRWMSPSEIFMMYGSKMLEEIGYRQTIGSRLYEGEYSYYDALTRPETGFGLDIFLNHNYTTGTFTKHALHHVNRNRRSVRVLDCQHRQLVPVRTLIDTATGIEKDIPSFMDDSRIREMIAYGQYRGMDLMVRNKIKPRVRRTVTAGDLTLYDDWSIYDRYTLVPYFPYFRRGKTMGMVEPLIDPQREINKRASALLHIIMTTANSGWMVEKASLDEDMLESLETEGARPGIVVEYEKGSTPPQRIQPAAHPHNVERLEDKATQDLKEIAGVNDSALGQIDDSAASGRAIQNRQRQSVIGAEIYFDNFSRSRELKGRNYLSICQNFYTEERIVLSRTDMGSDERLMINARDAAGNIKNNITIGKFTIAVDEAPMSSSFIQGQFDEALELLDRGIQIPQDILIDLSTMPRKEVIKERMFEDRMVVEDQQRLQSMGMRAGLGIPPGQPIPPVATDGQPKAVVVTPPTGVPSATGGQLPPSR